MAANHIFGLGELVPTATLVVAILVASAMPVYAQGQQPSAVQLKADAQNVVKIISGDKLKIESYCKFAEISDRSTKLLSSKTPGKLGSYPRGRRSCRENWVQNLPRWLTVCMT